MDRLHPGYPRPALRRLAFASALLVLLLLLGSEWGPPAYAQDDSPEGPAGTEPLEAARRAVVQVEAFGDFAAPQEATGSHRVGRGSGFIVHESGLAVTDNHVVAGATFIKVHLAGEERPRSARLVGYAECADLAVIHIQGEGFPALTWYPDPIQAGLEVYAAGFPLDTPEFTLAPGVISQTHADGNTPWASVESVIEHDARVDPGSAGGPLLDAQGRVVGVNHAGDPEHGPSLAIPKDLAGPLVEELAQGRSVLGLGINGQAATLDNGRTGIWVAAVDSGSPADRAGLEPDDILLTMEGVPLAADGTLAAYCDILRSHTPDEALDIRVLRPATGEILVGQINGRPLQPARASNRINLAQMESEPEKPLPPEPTPSPTDTQTYTGYVRIQDDAGVIQVEVPAAWNDVRGLPWSADDTNLGYSLVAAADLAAFYDTWGEPGVFIGVSRVLAEEHSPASYLDSIDLTGTCSPDGRSEMETEQWLGYMDLWTDCGDEGGLFANLALSPPDGSYLVVVQAVIMAEREVDALDRILTSLTVTWEQPQAAAPTLPDPRELLDLGQYQTEFTLFQDPALTVLVPTTWSDHRDAPWVLDEERVGHKFFFAPNVDDLLKTWDVPGMVFYVSPVLGPLYTPEEVLDAWTFADTCTLDERNTYTTTVGAFQYQGAVDLWTGCDDSGAVLVVAAATPPDRSHLVVAEFQLVTPEDAEALEAALTGFYVADPRAALERPRRSADPEADYHTVQDPTGYLRLEVPTAWEEVDAGPWTVEADTPDAVDVGVRLRTAPDIRAFAATWSGPGAEMRVARFPTLDLTDVLDLFDFAQSCTYNDRFPLEREGYQGVYDLWVDCGPDRAVLAMVAARPLDAPDLTAILSVQITDDESFAAFEHILETFQVDTTQELEAVMAVLAQIERRTDRENELDPGPTATVVVRALNVRAGPGTHYERVTVVEQGARLRVLGQVNDCSWIKVATPDRLEGWVAGGERFVSLSHPCRAIPQTEPPPAPPGQEALPSQTGSSGLNVGCYRFQNQLGVEVTVTFTRQEDHRNKTFKLAKGAEREECFQPGRYTYTLDAPPPWGSTNGELNVQAGDRYLFPIRGE